MGATAGGMQVYPLANVREGALQGWSGVRILRSEPGPRALHVELPGGAGTAWLVPSPEVWDWEPLQVPDSEFRRALDLDPDRAPLTDLGLREAVPARSGGYAIMHLRSGRVHMRPHGPWLAAVAASHQRWDNLD